MSDRLIQHREKVGLGVKAGLMAKSPNRHVADLHIIHTNSTRVRGLAHLRAN